MNSRARRFINLLLLASALAACASALELRRGQPLSEAAACQSGAKRTRAKRQALPKETRKKMDALFEKAVASKGQDYLDAEEMLLGGGEPAKATLRRNLNHPDPSVRLMAKVLLEWMEGRTPEYRAVLDYLEGLPIRLAETPRTEPDPSATAAYLTMHFADRVADFLALRLSKATDWPEWKVLAVLFYLSEQAPTSTTAILIRFASETLSPGWREAAIEALKARRDPDLRAKVAAERVRSEKLRKAFPKALADLEEANQDIDK
jgi:hypothetical protein